MYSTQVASQLVDLQRPQNCIYDSRITIRLYKIFFFWIYETVEIGKTIIRSKYCKKESVTGSNIIQETLVDST